MHKWILLLVAVLLCGCTKGGGGGSESLIKTYKPSTLPPQPASLVLAGTEVPVELNSELSSDKLKIQVTAFGEVLEEELYSHSPTSFALVEALSETYTPELPLLGKESSFKDEWKWKGVISTAGMERPASASINMVKTQLGVPGFDKEAAKVSVALAIESGQGAISKRQLAFFFVEGKGLLKREFGQASERIPRKAEEEPTSTPEE